MDVSQEKRLGRSIGHVLKMIGKCNMEMSLEKIGRVASPTVAAP